MRDTAGLESTDVVTGHVFAVAGEATEEQADVPRLDRNQMLLLAGLKTDGDTCYVIHGPAARLRQGYGGREAGHFVLSRAFGDSPSTLGDQPIDVGAHRVRKRFFDRDVGDPLSPVRFRDWQNNDGWLIRVGSKWVQRDIPVSNVSAHHGPECCVDCSLDIRASAEAGAKGDSCRTG